jgi:hypothetical protein
MLPKMKTKTKKTPALLGFMARSPYGETIHLREPRFPRQQLLAKLGRQHCQKMFVDTKTGEVKHVGYVIGGQWWTLYEVREFAR